MIYNAADIEKLKTIDKWYKENYWLFDLERVYGIEITAELFRLAKLLEEQETNDSN